MVSLPRGVDRFFRNFELLGSPIGDADFCSSFVKSFTKKAVVHTLGPLSSLDDPQVAHMLLRLCASFCRVVHLLRGVPIIFCTEAMQEFDTAYAKLSQLAWACSFQTLLGNKWLCLWHGVVLECVVRLNTPLVHMWRL